MAQTYQDKPSLAAWNALGGWEKIKEVTMQTTSMTWTIDLSDVDWAQWRYIALLFNQIDTSDSEASPNYHRISLDGIGSRCAHMDSDFLYMRARSFLMLYLPLRDASRDIRAVTFGYTSEYSIGNSTFANLQTMIVRTTQRLMPIGTSYSLWGCR